MLNARLLGYIPHWMSLAELQRSNPRPAKTLYQKFDTNIPKKVDRSWDYINRSQIHKCGNWERGRAVSFLGIYINWIFFAVRSVLFGQALCKTGNFQYVVNIFFAYLFIK
jgi:hypothetical protein